MVHEKSIHDQPPQHITRPEIKAKNLAFFLGEAPKTDGGWIESVKLWFLYSSSNGGLPKKSHPTPPLKVGKLANWIASKKSPQFKTMCQVIQFVTFLGWLSDPFKGLSDLQLGDEKVTLNHLVDVFLLSTWALKGWCVNLDVRQEPEREEIKSASEGADFGILEKVWRTGGGEFFFRERKGTPWKINMEPTNHPFRKENDLPNVHDYVTF